MLIQIRNTDKGYFTTADIDIDINQVKDWLLVGQDILEVAPDISEAEKVFLLSGIVQDSLIKVEDPSQVLRIDLIRNTVGIMTFH